MGKGKTDLPSDMALDAKGQKEFQQKVAKIKKKVNGQPPLNSSTAQLSAMKHVGIAQ